MGSLGIAGILWPCKWFPKAVVKTQNENWWYFVHCVKLPLLLNKTLVETDPAH
jgi:hypothetical protein